MWHSKHELLISSSNYGYQLPIALIKLGDINYWCLSPSYVIFVISPYWHLISNYVIFIISTTVSHIKLCGFQDINYWYLLISQFQPCDVLDINYSYFISDYVISIFSSIDISYLSLRYSSYQLLMCSDQVLWYQLWISQFELCEICLTN